MIKKADKGTTRVIMNKEDKIKECQSQLDNTDHYQPLEHPMVIETASKVTSLIEDLYDGQFIDETAMEWLLQTPKPPRVYRSLTVHANKNSQTQTCWPPNHFGMGQSDRKDIGIC